MPEPPILHPMQRDNQPLSTGVRAILNRHDLIGLLFRFSRDLHHSHATFRCRINGGGTISGGGVAVDGRANYLLTIRLRQ